MKYWLASLTAALLAGAAYAQDSSTIATVDLGSNTGTPTWYASGFLYGIPDKQGQVPDHFYTQIGFRATRAGGARLPAPSLGWVDGKGNFTNRFKSAVSNYRTARKYGAQFQLLSSDLWGSDFTSSVPMPGDNGNWTSYENFLTSVIHLIKHYKMQDGLVFEPWNEPEGGYFWTASQQQYLEMWVRSHKRIRSAFPKMQIIGPSTGDQPSLSNNWVVDFYKYVKQHKAIPDIYSWHEECCGGSVDVDVANQHAVEQSLGLPNNPICINEYGTYDEQQPAGDAWYISQLERTNTSGLRGNWAVNYSLHDYLANLLGKPNASESEGLSEWLQGGYWPTSSWLVYQYYYQNMTGHRLATTSSGDALFDVYATYDPSENRVKMLCGTRQVANDYYITVNNLTSLGLPASGTIDILTYHFDWNENNIFQETNLPSNQSYYGHQYSGNSMTFLVGATNTTAYAFEFSTPK